MSRFRNVIAVFIAAAGVTLAGCDLPRDPHGTTEKVRGTTLTVGVEAEEEPSDRRERAALERLADRLDADLVYERGELHRLVKRLEDGKIDLIAGHLPRTTPFAGELGTTAAVSSMTLGDRQVKTVFAIRKGENGFLAEVEKAIGETP